MPETLQSRRNTRIEDALIGWCELRFRELSLGRDAEEREWQEEALFYQRRQWLEWKQNEHRFEQIQPSKSKPRPMPVSNYYAKTINANANQLGANLVRVVATPMSDDSETRRAADYAEKAKDALDNETNLRLLNPLLAKHCALWGMGIIKDEIDTTSDQEEMDEQEVMSSNVVGCLDCGSMYDTGEASENPDDAIGQQEQQCPDCGSMQTVSFRNDTATTVSQYVTGKGTIRSRVVPLFEVYLPRDVQNANLSDEVYHRYRRPVSMIRRKFGEAADDIKIDDPASNKAETRLDSLKTLGAFNFLEKHSAETATLSEGWIAWDKLPKKLQEAIEREAGEVEEDDILVEEEQTIDPETLAEMKKRGIFIIYCQGTMLQWGANPFFDPDSDETYNVFTFFLWDVDPASVYPKGVGADLVPLQKRLNRLDSLIELAMMTNAVGKWIWPDTQSKYKPPSGDPADVVTYDPIGDGKLKPEFVTTNPVSGQVWQLRAAILSDFQQLGLTLGIMEGNASSQSAFRTVAYLGAKAAEQLNTQRFLWESAHCLHYKKLLAMAKWVWDEERQVKVSGPNGKMMFDAFTGEDLRGKYSIDYVPDSSIPKTQAEKLQMMQQLILAQLVDITDPQTRQYLYDIINLEGLNLTGELQFRKAERDLEAVKRGEMPIESPYQDWQIALKIAANFTLTEEFEALNPQLQSYVLAYTEYLNERVTMINQQMQTQMLMQRSAEAMATASANPDKSADPNNKKLAKVPGTEAPPEVAEGAAASQGDQFAQNLGA